MTDDIRERIALAIEARAEDHPLTSIVGDIGFLAWDRVLRFAARIARETPVRSPWVGVAERLPPAWDMGSGVNRSESLVLVCWEGHPDRGPHKGFRVKSWDRPEHWTIEGWSIEATEAEPPTHWMAIPPAPEPMP